MSSPIKLSWKTEALSVVLLALGFILGFYYLQNFPAQVATHWGLDGEANGYSSAAFAAFFLPFLNLGLYLLFLALPYLDPKKEEYASFAKAYQGVKNLILGFMFILFVLTGVNGLGYTVPIGFWLPILMGFLFIVLGNILSKVKMNWFLGIRTPWTLSSETVWEKTHALGVPVFSLAGLLIAATVLVTGAWKIVFFVAAVVLIAIGLPLYSYLVYRQEQKVKK